MAKAKSPRRVADNEALAVGTTIRGSAQKLNLVAALIRGKKAEEAMNILSFSKRAMASLIFSKPPVWRMVGVAEVGRTKGPR